MSRTHARTPRLRAWAAAATLAALPLLYACPDATAPAADGHADDASPLDTADAADAADLAPDALDDTAAPPVCALDPGTEPEFARRLGCPDDFAALSSPPLDASIPGARSLKTVIDRADGGALYFQNSKLYQIHWDFTSEHLSGNGLPPVPPLGQFNDTEYYSQDRRFILGALTHYEGPDVWAYEISPYDTASAAMIEQAYAAIAANTWLGDRLVFHPTSQAVETVAALLPATVPVVSTEQLYEGIVYQPLNLATAIGRLRSMTAQQAEAGPLFFRDLVVLDAVPNDIGVVAGIITAQFQTPLSHINVLSQNRGTPNMALIGAKSDPQIVALQDKWVRLTVGAFEYSLQEVTQAEADAWWEAHKPAPVAVPDMDLTVTDLTAIEDVLDIGALGLGPALAKAIPAFGGKASHYGAFPDMDPSLVPTPKAFAVPLYHYVKHMSDHGIDAMVDALLADAAALADPIARDKRLVAIQDAIIAAPMDPALLAAIEARMASDFPGIGVRFRSSTNAEDLDGFTGAGLYTSKTGTLDDPSKSVAEAVRKVWASMWNSRAFQEREYRSIDHRRVGMALLAHRSFSDEEANGVALTANIFDTTGLEPGFYVNVQKGEASVVQPEPSTTTDSFIYHFTYPGQPIVFLSHSNLVLPGETVLTTTQTYELGVALDTIHKFFQPLYGTKPGAFFAMDVEFKFDGAAGETSKLFIKQARPHAGWGL
jgi:pyruvate,water dikinase